MAERHREIEPEICKIGSGGWPDKTSALVDRLKQVEPERCLWAMEERERERARKTKRGFAMSVETEID